MVIPYSTFLKYMEKRDSLYQEPEPTAEQCVIHNALVESDWEEQGMSPENQRIYIKRVGERVFMISVTPTGTILNRGEI